MVQTSSHCSCYPSCHPLCSWAPGSLSHCLSCSFFLKFLWVFLLHYLQSCPHYHFLSPFWLFHYQPYILQPHPLTVLCFIWILLSTCWVQVIWILGFLFEQKDTSQHFLAENLFCTLNNFFFILKTFIRALRSNSKVDLNLDFNLNTYCLVARQENLQQNLQVSLGFTESAFIWKNWISNSCYLNL